MHKVTLNKQTPARVLHMDIELPALPAIGTLLTRDEPWLNERVVEVIFNVDDQAIAIVVEPSSPVDDDVLDEYLAAGWQ